jgi:Domain of unknown function (DUF3598)
VTEGITSDGCVFICLIGAMKVSFGHFVLSCFMYMSSLSTSFELPRSCNNGIRRRLTLNLLSSAGVSGTMGVSELQKFHNAQWDLYLKHHAGYWKGVQTGYDPENEEVADFMYTEVNLEKNADSSEIIHTNSYVQGEIRSDCETCFDSERLKSKQVGVYSAGKLRSRLCANVEIRGPGVTPNGLSTEIIFRHNNGRMRVLLAHSAIDFIELEGLGVVPSTFLLKDIVVIRERLDSRPYDLDIGPDDMWVPTSSSAFQGSYAGQRQRFTNSGELSSDPVSFPVLPLCKVAEEEISELLNTNLEDNMIISRAPAPAISDPSDDMFRRVFKGGLFIEAPWVISADVGVRARISWKPDQGEKLYAAEIGVLMSSSDAFRLPNGSSRLHAPKLTEFFVDDIVRTSSS